ncbi:unnamed protein product [Ascophyllum nodosum]
MAISTSSPSLSSIIPRSGRWVSRTPQSWSAKGNDILEKKNFKKDAHGCRAFCSWLPPAHVEKLPREIRDDVACDERAILPCHLQSKLDIYGSPRRPPNPVLRKRVR